MAPHFMLEAMSVNFELILVDRKNNEQKSADYLLLNPAGRIPTLIDPHYASENTDNKGFAIFESPAICIHLAEMNPQANLIPQIGDRNRAIFLQWMMYLTNTVQAELMMCFYPENHTTDVKRIKTIEEAQELRVIAMFELLDQELKGKSYLIGEAISACDYFLFMLAVWADELKRPPLSFKYLGKYLCQLAQRDEIVSVCKTECLSLADYKSC
jgi:glutathione S-transferase